MPSFSLLSLGLSAQLASKSQVENYKKKSSLSYCL